MKLFPFEFESKKEILFYPDKPQSLAGDILEIGPGRGDFIVSQATLYPHKKFIAIELGKKRFYSLVKKIKRLELTNILLICGDARIVIPHCFKEDFFERIYVLFPDPWPKDRHAFRRLLSVSFLWLLAHHLEKEGELIIGTDVKSYALWITDNLKEVIDLHPQIRPSGEYATYFEKKWKAEGRELFYMRYSLLP